MKSNIRSMLHIFIISTVVILAYSGTLKVPFHFDDHMDIVNNPNIRDLTVYFDSSKAEPFAENGYFRYFHSRIVGFFTLAVNYHFDGLNVAGYHIVNIAIHAINALLIYALVLTVFRTPFLSENAMYAGASALISALLFASHPIETQSVTYIKQRFASLATLFYLVSLLSYFRCRLATGWRMKILYIVSLFSCVLAMKTKEIAFTLPLMLILSECYFFEGIIRSRIIKLMPFVLTMAIIPISLLDFGTTAEITKVQTEITRWQYLITEFRVIMTYLRLLILPIGQSIDYDYPMYTSLTELPVLLSFVSLTCIFAFCIYLYRRGRRNSAISLIASYGIVWFFVTISVESSIIPIVDFINEHRLYLPSIGIFIAVSILMSILYHKASRYSYNTGRLIAGLYAIVIISLSAAAFDRNTMWLSESFIWEDAYSKYPNKARILANLGVEFLKHGDIKRAKYLLGKAVKIRPQNDLFRYNYAIAHISAREYKKAERILNVAIKLKPDRFASYMAMGESLFYQGEYISAAESYKKAIRINPGNAGAHSSISVVYAKLDKASLSKNHNTISKFR